MSETLKPTFLQLPVQKVLDRVSLGGSSVDELWRLFHGRTELEEKNIIFSLKSSNIGIHNSEIPHSSAAHAAGLLKNYYVFSSREQSLFHENMSNQVVKSLEATKNNSSSLVEHHKNLIRYANKQSESSYDALEKAKNNYKKAEIDLLTASEKLEHLKKLESEEGGRNYSEKRKDGISNDKEGIPFINLNIRFVI